MFNMRTIVERPQVVVVTMRVLLEAAEEQQLLVVHDGRVAAASARSLADDAVWVSSSFVGRLLLLWLLWRVVVLVDERPLARLHVERVHVVRVEGLARVAHAALVHAAAEYVDGRRVVAAIVEHARGVKVAPVRPYVGLGHDERPRARGEVELVQIVAEALELLHKAAEYVHRVGECAGRVAVATVRQLALRSHDAPVMSLYTRTNAHT